MMTKEKAAEHLQAFRTNRYALGASEGDEMDRALTVAIAALGDDRTADRCPACKERGHSDHNCWYCDGTNIDAVLHPEQYRAARLAQLGW